MNNRTLYPKAGLGSRLYALIYDGILVLALEFFAAGIVVAILKALVAAGLMTYAPYSGASDLLGGHPILRNLYTLYLGGIWISFFVYFWTTTGQTPGMRARKLRLQNPDGSLVSITQALIRIGTSAFGLSNLSSPFDRQKRGFHDVWAKTDVVVLTDQVR
ncbi:hypothetical protein DI392_08410 [Vibrio albus]|uniref:RDD domain-containing protein n=1 Tax=Vibrio albus TaxID=2200953 RepID=A0A2U3BAG6_9VIBR|nr:RDD family protein [Vibrio albus]PWI33777.1 hypothetical protein DI392_08410 [Vibrio albus]